MKLIEVKARAGMRIPTPIGTIGPDKYVQVPQSLYIRRRLAEGDLVLRSSQKKKKAVKKRRTS